MHDLTLADELGGEFGRAAALACGAAKDESVGTILNYGVSGGPAIGTRHLSYRLEADYGAATELTQARQCVLESVVGAEGVQRVDNEPEVLIAFATVHCFEDGESHPCRNDGAQCGYLASYVREKECSARAAGGSG